MPTSETTPDLAYIYTVLGRKGEAWKILRRLLTLSKQAPVQPGLIALIYIGLGENDEALVWLEKAYSDDDLAQSRSPIR